MSKDDEIISTREYDKTHPVYIKIKKEFAKLLKSKYNCDDFDKIVDYVMQFVFEKKATKAECISNMDSLFNGKADVMMNFLWDLTKDIENSSNDDFNKKKSWKYKNRERSRSNSNENSKNKFNYNNYSKYQNNMMPRGFYPPKVRYGAPMMPMNMAFGQPMNPYVMPNPFLMQR